MPKMRPPIKDRPFRIASYNIRKARGLDGRRDPKRVIDVLNQLDADVIVLQEADNRLGKRRAAIPRDVIDRYSDFEVVPIATNGVSLGWHGNAVLVRRGTAISGSKRIELPGLEPRGAVAVKLANELTIVGVHLGLLRSSRRKQLASIIANLGHMTKSIVIGDMNEWARTRGFEALSEGFNLYSPGFSFHTARPIAALDRVAMTHDLMLCDAGVEDGALAKLVSDHLPIWADIRSAPDAQEIKACSS